MKYAILECVNGTYVVRAEAIATVEAAKVQWHDRCKILWNAPDVLTAFVMIADEQLDCVEGCKEFIHHEPQPEPAPEPEVE